MKRLTDQNERVPENPSPLSHPIQPSLPPANLSFLKHWCANIMPFSYTYSSKILMTREFTNLRECDRRPQTTLEKMKNLDPASTPESQYPHLIC